MIWAVAVVPDDASGRRVAAPASRGAKLTRRRATRRGIHAMVWTWEREGDTPDSRAQRRSGGNSITGPSWQKEAGSMSLIFVFFVTAVSLFSRGNHADAATGDAAEAPPAGVILKGGQIDSSTVEVGAFAVVIHGQGERHPVSGEWERLETARGYIQAINAETLTLSRGRDGRQKPMALERILTLVLVGTPSRRATERVQRVRPDGLQIQTLTVVDRRHAESPTTLDSLAESRGISTGKRVALKLITGPFIGMLGGVIGGSYCDDGQDLECLGPFFYSYLAGIAIGVSAVDYSVVDPRYDPSMLSFITSTGVSLGGCAVGLIGGIWLTTIDSGDAILTSLLIGPVIGATLASEWWRKFSAARGFSIGFAPNPRGSLSAVATLRF